MNLQQLKQESSNPKKTNATVALYVIINTVTVQRQPYQNYPSPYQVPNNKTHLRHKSMPNSEQYNPPPK